VIELVKKGELQELVEPGTRDREHSTMRGSQSARATGEVGWWIRLASLPDAWFCRGS
jgi:hypothetical protein